MKNTRYLLLAGLVVVGVILYGLYRTGSLKNKTRPSVSAEDNLLKNAEDTALTTGSTMLDTFSMLPPLSSPSQNALTKQEIKSIAPSSPPEQSLSTALANPPLSKPTKEEAQKKTTKPNPVEGTTDKAPYVATLSNPSKESSAQRFHVIVGSFSQEANAQAKALDFEHKNNKKATVIKQGGYFRVCADEFEFASSAALYAQKLKEAGFDFIILKF